MLHRTKLSQATYWKGSLEDKENVLFLKYEEIIEEPRVQVKRLAEFLNCPSTEEEEKSGLVEEILKWCSLRNLGDLETTYKKGRTDIHYILMYSLGKVKLVTRRIISLIIWPKPLTRSSNVDYEVPV
ncbi:unnamed protein product [Arabis nemorensis]|uniref:Sulfotransferase n=1 Tax=Arabis nemorensis TaxID=586526 RepID=A0A565B3R8_9BRAS|nr:unnamed protein product [Arabis nemorensis]